MACTAPGTLDEITFNPRTTVKVPVVEVVRVLNNNNNETKANNETKENREKALQIIDNLPILINVKDLDNDNVDKKNALTNSA